MTKQNESEVVELKRKLEAAYDTIAEMTTDCNNNAALVDELRAQVAAVPVDTIRSVRDAAVSYAPPQSFAMYAQVEELDEWLFTVDGAE